MPTFLGNVCPSTEQSKTKRYGDHEIIIHSSHYSVSWRKKYFNVELRERLPYYLLHLKCTMPQHHHAHTPLQRYSTPRCFRHPAMREDSSPCGGVNGAWQFPTFDMASMRLMLIALVLTAPNEYCSTGVDAAIPSRSSMSAVFAIGGATAALTVGSVSTKCVTT